MSMIRPIFLIAGNTVTGVLRGVVLNVLLVLAGLLIITATMSGTFEEGEKLNRMLVDSGLGIITILGAMIAILTGFIMIPREIETRTIYPILSKPVYRWQFVLGKFFGAVGVNAITVALLSFLFFVVYLLKTHYFDVRLLTAIMMIFFTLVVLSGLIVFLSTFMSWIGTIIVAGVVWFLGSYSQFLFDLAGNHSDNQLTSIVVKLLHYLLPNFQAMDLRYAIVEQELTRFEAMQILMPMGAGALFVLIVLALGILIFNYREL